MPGSGARNGEPPGLSVPAFVGRQREVAALADAMAHSPAVILIEGEAGIGKSRLLQEFLALDAVDRQRALVAVCPPFRGPFTLAPIVDALRQARDDVAGLPLSPLAGALRPLFPEWTADLPPEPPPAEDATASRHRVFRALVELLGCLDVRLLAVEDVHWADEATLEYLLFLASRRPQPVSLAVTFRRDELASDSLLLRLSSRLPAGTTHRRIVLEPLGVDDTAEMVSSMLAEDRLSAGFAAFLHRSTDGIPLAVEESVRLMHDRADLARRDGEWVRRRLASIAVPPTVRDAVLERAARLDADVQLALRAAAVLAEPADEQTLIAVTGLRAERAAAGLGAALESGLVDVDARHLLAFRHALAARAVYESIMLPERRAMHLRAAQALTKLPARIPQLARHYREAGFTAEWSRYAEQAADLAIASGDEATAAALLHDLLSHADLAPATVVRLMNKLPVVALGGLPAFRGLLDCLRAALDCADVGAEDEAQVRFHLGRLLLVLGDHEDGRVELERAIPGLATDPVKASRAMTLLGWPRGTPWPAHTHRQWLQRASELADAMTPRDRLYFVVDGATAFLMLGEEDGWSHAARIPQEPPTPQDRQIVTIGHLNVGDGAMRWGRYAESRSSLETALKLTELHQYAYLRGIVVVTIEHLNWFTGRWDGLAERARSFAVDEDILPTDRHEAELVCGLWHTSMGDRDLAEDYLSRVLARTRETSAFDHAVEPAAALARLWLLDRRVDDALAVTDELIGIVRHKGTWVWATDLGPARVAALLAAGRDDDAADLVNAFDTGLRNRDAPAPRAALVVCRALLAEAGGDHAGAAEEFGRAVIAWDALPRPYDAHLARERQGRCLNAAGEAEQGLAVLSEAFAGLSTLGATRRCGAREPVAARARGARSPSRSRTSRVRQRALTARTRRREASRHRPDRPGDRRDAVRVAEDRRLPPRLGPAKAQCALAYRAGGNGRGHRAGTRA